MSSAGEGDAHETNGVEEDSSAAAVTNPAGKELMNKKSLLARDPSIAQHGESTLTSKKVLSSSNDMEEGNRPAAAELRPSLGQSQTHEGEQRDGASAATAETLRPDGVGIMDLEAQPPTQSLSAITLKDTKLTSNDVPTVQGDPSEHTELSRDDQSRVGADAADHEWNEKFEEPQHPRATTGSGGDFDEKPKGDEMVESRPEIENIMQQFGEDQGNELSAITSPSGSELPVFRYPPRSSSLASPDNDSTAATVESPRQPRLSPTSRLQPVHSDSTSLSLTPSIASVPPLPEPDPEPDLPFDFHRFLEQLRHRTADPVAKFLRSFLLEFGKKQWQVHEQVKIITDFLIFISGKMAQCDVWRSVSEAEFDNAREGMEKLVMNRLYNQTFSPEIPAAEPNISKGRRKTTSTVPVPGRKGQHEEDVERDEVLAQKVRIYRWIREEHLDIRPFSEKGKKFVVLAQQELTRIKSYRAPRDKVICVLNCCKVIFGYLRNAHSDQSADAFIPLLIYTVLKANPEHLVSNVQYILRFRSQDKLSGEAGYYMSSLMGAVQFIENLDRTNLTISDEAFEANVEAAVSTIAEPHRRQQALGDDKRLMQPSAHPSFNEKSALSRPEVTPRHSMDAERSGSRRPSSRQPESNSGDEIDENAAVSGLLRTIQKPLSTIGRLFSDEHNTQQVSSRPPSAPQLLPTSAASRPPRSSSMQPAARIPQSGDAAAGTAAPASEPGISAEESVARQVSAETEQAQRVTRAEHKTVVETLSGMFPDLDKEVISDVVRVKEGRVGLAVDACLALSR